MNNDLFVVHGYKKDRIKIIRKGIAKVMIIEMSF